MENESYNRECSGRVATWQSLKQDPLILELQRLEGECRRLATEAQIYDSQKYPILKRNNFIQNVFGRLSANFTIMVIGQVSSGKSFFINSLLGERFLLPSGDPTDGVISILQHKQPEDSIRAEKVLADGLTEPFRNLGEALKFLRQQDTNPEDQLACSEVRFFLDNPCLNHIRFINTPGLGDRLQAFEDVTLKFLDREETDLVVWIFNLLQAANEPEIGIFSRRLADRRGTVLGLITASCENHENDPNYLPQSDPDIIDVVDEIQEFLGDYLEKVICYDSKVVLQAKTTFAAGKLSEEALARAFEQSGYNEFWCFVTDRLGDNGEKIEATRVNTMLMRCANHAVDLSRLAMAAADNFTADVGDIQNELKALQILDEKVLNPARTRTKAAVSDLAAKEAESLVAIRSNAAVRAVRDKFNMPETLFRTLTSWTPWIDSPAEKIQAKMQEYIEVDIKKSRFMDSLNDKAAELFEEQLLALKVDLEKFDHEIDVIFNPEIIGPGKGIPVDGTIGGAISTILKGILEPLIRKLMKEGAEETVGAAGKKVAKNAAGEAAVAVAEQAGKEAVGKFIARSAGILMLVLATFDAKKFFSDFEKGKSNLTEQIERQFQADTSLIERQLFDVLWQGIRKGINHVLAKGQAAKDKLDELREKVRECNDCSRDLDELAARLDSLRTDESSK